MSGTSGNVYLLTLPGSHTLWIRKSDAALLRLDSGGKPVQMSMRTVLELLGDASTLSDAMQGTRIAKVPHGASKLVDALRSKDTFWRVWSSLTADASVAAMTTADFAEPTSSAGALYCIKLRWSEGAPSAMWVASNGTWDSSLVVSEGTAARAAAQLCGVNGSLLLI